MHLKAFTEVGGWGVSDECHKEEEHFWRNIWGLGACKHQGGSLGAYFGAKSSQIPQNCAKNNVLTNVLTICWQNGSLGVSPGVSRGVSPGVSPYKNYLCLIYVWFYAHLAPICRLLSMTKTGLGTHLAPMASQICWLWGTRAIAVRTTIRSTGGLL